MAKPSKGGGTVTYACATADVIKVTKAGKVTIVKTFDKTCKTLSKQTKDTIKKVSTKVTMSVPATTNYKAASTSVTVTINKNRYVFSVPMTVLINTAIRRRVHCLRDLLIIKN